MNKYSALAAVAGIVAIEIVALCQGINGTILATSLTILGGIGGFELKKLLK